MTMQASARKLAFLLLPFLLITAGALAQDRNAVNRGTITILNGFGGNINSPGPILEVSPGNFVGLADSQQAFLLTSQGALSVIYQFYSGSGPVPYICCGPTQALNGRLYGSEANPAQNFSFDLNGNMQSYPGISPVPPFLAIATPDGSL